MFCQSSLQCQKNTINIMFIGNYHVHYTQKNSLEDIISNLKKQNDDKNFNFATQDHKLLKKKIPLQMKDLFNIVKPQQIDEKRYKLLIQQQDNIIFIKHLTVQSIKHYLLKTMSKQKINYQDYFQQIKEIPFESQHQNIRQKQYQFINQEQFFKQKDFQKNLNRQKQYQQNQKIIYLQQQQQRNSIFRKKITQKQKRKNPFHEQLEIRTKYISNRQISQEVKNPQGHFLHNKISLSGQFSSSKVWIKQNQQQIQKQVKSLKEKDCILIYDLTNNKTSYSFVRNLKINSFSQCSNKLIKFATIQFSNKKQIRVLQNQKIYGKSFSDKQEWIQINQSNKNKLQKSKFISFNYLTKQMQEISIFSINFQQNFIQKQFPFVEFSVDNYHNFFAESIILHNVNKIVNVFNPNDTQSFILEPNNNQNIGELMERYRQRIGQGFFSQLNGVVLNKNQLPGEYQGRALLFHPQNRQKINAVKIVTIKFSEKTTKIFMNQSIQKIKQQLNNLVFEANDKKYFQQGQKIYSLDQMIQEILQFKQNPQRQVNRRMFQAISSRDADQKCIKEILKTPIFKEQKQIYFKLKIQTPKCKRKFFKNQQELILQRFIKFFSAKQAQSKKVLDYKTFNKVLRNSVKQSDAQQEKSWMQNKQSILKLAALGWKALLLKKKVSKIVYRGIHNVYFEKLLTNGTIVHFQNYYFKNNAFLSSSIRAKQAYKFMNQKGSFLTIKIYSGRNISQQSHFSVQCEVLLLPTKKYFVHSVYSIKNPENIIQNNSIQNVLLEEIPTPETNAHNIIYWVDDQPQNIQKIYRQNFNNQDYQLVTVYSHQLMKIVIKQILTNLRCQQKKVVIVSKMKLPQNYICKNWGLTYVKQKQSDLYKLYKNVKKPNITFNQKGGKQILEEIIQAQISKKVLFFVDNAIQTQNWLTAEKYPSQSYFVTSKKKEIVKKIKQQFKKQIIISFKKDIVLKR